MGDHPGKAESDRAHRAVSLLVGDLHRDDACARCNPDDAGLRPVSTGAVTRDEPRVEGAVAVAIRAAFGGEVRALDDSAGEPRDLVDAGVDDGDRHAGAAAVPAARDGDLSRGLTRAS